MQKYKKPIITAVALLAIVFAIALFHAPSSFDYQTTLTVSCPELGIENVKAKADIYTFLLEEFGNERAWLLEDVIIDDEKYSLMMFVEPSSGGLAKDESGRTWNIAFPPFKVHRINWFGLGG